MDLLSNMPEKYKKTKVGIIPKNWNVSTLEDCTIKIGSGITPKGGKEVYKKLGRPFLRSQNVAWGKLLLEDVVFIDNETHATFISTEIKEKDVFLNITGASIGRSAVADKRVINGNVNQHVCIIRTKEEILEPFFLNHFLLSKFGQRQIDSYQAGGNRPGLNFGQIKSFEIPLPPLPEQQKIAQILSTWDRAIEKTEQLITARTRHKKALMQQLLTGKKRFKEFEGGDVEDCEYKKTVVGNIPSDWKKMYFAKFGKVIDGDRGINYPSKKDFSKNGYCLFLSAKNVTRKGFKFSDCLFINKEKDELLNKGKLIRNDIVLTTRGTVGNSAYYNNKVFFENIRINSGMVILRNKDKNVDNKYLFNIIQSEIIKKQIYKIVFGSAQPQLTVKGISKLKFPLPPTKAEQQKIASVLSNGDKEIELLNKKLEALKKQKKGLMQKLLTGQIRVKIDN